MSQQYTINYSLKSRINGGQLEESISISSEVDEAIAIPGEIECLRDLAFGATHSDELLEKLRAEKRTLNYECQKAASQVQAMKATWDKSAEFLRTQGLKDDVPKFPIRCRRLESSPEVLLDHEGHRF